MDRHGNINAEEGCTLCWCGGKFWENDRCVSCGTLVEIAKMKVLGRDSRYGQAIWLNVQSATMAHGLGLDGSSVTDLLDINKRFNVVSGHIYGGF